MSPETNGKSNLRRWFGGAHFVWALLVPTVASAEPISDIDVTSVVETWVRHVTADARPDAAVARLEPHVGRRPNHRLHRSSHWRRVLPVRRG